MPVGQNSLSAGEKQLLALARAVLRHTNIVILDEATAQVDQELDDKVIYAASSSQLELTFPADPADDSSRSLARSDHWHCAPAQDRD
jgi:ABC-type uncharacterized transport system YnjBCD ATPase subunit